MNLKIEASKSELKRIEAKARERLAKRRRSLQMDVSSYVSSLAELTSKLEKVEEEVASDVQKFAEACIKLKRAGIKFDNPWGLVLQVRTTKKGLLKVYKAIGRLDGSKVSKQIESAEKQLIQVTVPSANYPNLQVSYIHKLSPNDKCKIVKQTREYDSLVCEKK